MNNPGTNNTFERQNLTAHLTAEQLNSATHQTCERLKSPSQLQHDEESTSFMFSSLDARQVVDTKPQFSSLDSRQVADSKPLDSAHWEWKVKIRPDGSR